MNNLIQTSKEKGYPHSYDNLVDNQNYAHLCLLQKWLRDDRGVVVIVDYDGGYYWEIYQRELKVRKFLSECNSALETYEQALQEALTKSLILI